MSDDRKTRPQAVKIRKPSSDIGDVRYSDYAADVGGVRGASAHCQDPDRRRREPAGRRPRWNIGGDTRLERWLLWFEALSSHGPDPSAPAFESMRAADSSLDTLLHPAMRNGGPVSRNLRGRPTADGEAGSAARAIGSKSGPTPPVTSSVGPGSRTGVRSVSRRTRERSGAEIRAKSGTSLAICAEIITWIQSPETPARKKNQDPANCSSLLSKRRNRCTGPHVTSRRGP